MFLPSANANRDYSFRFFSFSLAIEIIQRAHLFSRVETRYVAGIGPIMDKSRLANYDYLCTSPSSLHPKTSPRGTLHIQARGQMEIEKIEPDRQTRQPSCPTSNFCKRWRRSKEPPRHTAVAIRLRTYPGCYTSHAWIRGDWGYFINAIKENS